MAIDWNKPLKTKNGREVEIYTKDGYGLYSVLGAYTTNCGKKWPLQWDIHGRCHQGVDYDLINLPRSITQELWVNLYEGHFVAHYSLGAALENCAPKLLARRHVVVTATEGEFDG